jgi:hypothetical protein
MDVVIRPGRCDAFMEPITAELIAQQSYLLVTDDDFARATGAMKMMV